MKLYTYPNHRNINGVFISNDLLKSAVEKFNKENSRIFIQFKRHDVESYTNYENVILVSKCIDFDEETKQYYMECENIETPIGDEYKYILDALPFKYCIIWNGIGNIDKNRNLVDYTITNNIYLEDNCKVEKNK